MSEVEWQSQVIAYARLMGFAAAHFRPARTKKGWRTAVEADGSGFPDVVLLRGPAIVVAELKAQRGRLTARQAWWLALFRAAGVPAYCWRPSDWPEVVEVLRR